MSPAGALLRFHLGAGARLAMRAGVPAAALLTAAIGLGPDPGATLRRAATDLAGATGSPVVALVLAAVAAGMALWAGPRICHGMAGWIRHLPADWRAHRRALLGALVAAQLPVAAAWIGFWFAAWSLGTDVDLRRLLALPPTLAGVALAVAPSRWAVPLTASGVAIVGLALLGGWSGLATAWILPVLTERLFVPRTTGRPGGLLWQVRVPTALIPTLIDYRALGFRLPGACAPALLPFGAAWMFVRNNTDVATAGPLRFAAGCGVALVLAGLAEELANRRPPWRWARSLPWSAAERIGQDARWVAVHTVPILALFAFVLDPGAALLAASTVPLVALRAASSLRRPHVSANTWARVFAEGVFVAAWLGVTVWTSVLALALIWPVHRAAARLDRDLDVSRWSPRDHLASGDPSSWRGA